MKIEKIKIKNSEIQDFNQVFLLLNQLWQNKELNKNNLKNVFKKGLTSKNEIYLCAEVNNKIIGFCSLAIRNSLWQEACMGHICELIVHKDYRKNKIGTKLIYKISDIAKKRGCKKIELDSAFKRKKAHIFYKKLGFENRAYLFSKDL